MSGIVAQNTNRHTGLVKASSGGGGVWNLIETLTASSSATLSFTSGIDSTYDEYVFRFYNIHPSAEASFGINFSDDGGSNYDLAKQSTSFSDWHNEADTDVQLVYRAAYDLANGTGFQPIGGDVMTTNNDECGDGFLQLFTPSSTTFVKQFISRYTPHYPTFAQDGFTSGYVNDTAAITAVQFAMSTGYIDAGSISLYGIS